MSPELDTAVSQPAASGFLMITALLLVDSLHYVFARLLLPHISPAVSALYVMAIATAEVGLYGLVRKRLHLGATREHLWPLLAIGFLVAASVNMTYESAAYIDPGTGSLLGQTSTLFALALGLLWLRERLNPAQALGAVLALAGVAVITFQRGEYMRVGAVLVLSSAFLYALHAAIAKRHSGSLEFLDFFFLRLLCTTVFLLVFAAGRRSLALPSPRAWLLVILVGTVDVVLSRALYYTTLQQWKMSVHSIVLTLSPVATVVWSVLLFGTLPTVRQLAGGVAVLLGTLIVVRQRRTSSGAKRQSSEAVSSIGSP